MRYSRKHERTSTSSYNQHGLLKHDLEEQETTFELSSEFGVLGREVHSLKQYLKRT
ncbi:hypothetical protein [Bacillus kexueae]|uniref:hypothetical protein n=1 Tax=Aeribacillus kexueae TaxID=2078952 RepID=UPI001FAFCE63|nr:hypothetical protein [Bacillus kexueae]